LVTARQSLNASYPATRDVVPLIRNAVAEYAASLGFTGRRLDAVRLAVSEAVTNAIVHGYRGQIGRVHVTARAVDDELWVMIADDGCGPQTPPQSPGLGWGLALITDAADGFTFLERAEGGTEAQMRFTIKTRH
jgi:anti-sigma regulatory factor (Ser/Thr protein kinase)